MKKTSTTKCNEEVMKFIIANVHEKTNKELAELINNKFNKNLKESSVKRYKNLKHLKSGLDTRFYVGKNKNIGGRKLAPIGSESFFNGYLHVKVAHPSVWKRKHILLWEKAYGKVPEGHWLIFLDNNPKNVCLQNLALVSGQEYANLNFSGLRTCNKDLTKTAITAVKLKIAIKERKRI